jgi:hypothetical protein
MSDGFRKDTSVWIQKISPPHVPFMHPTKRTEKMGGLWLNILAICVLSLPNKNV